MNLILNRKQPIYDVSSYYLVSYKSLGRQRPANSDAALLNRQLLAKRKVFKNYALFAPEYKP